MTVEPNGASAGPIAINLANLQEIGFRQEAARLRKEVARLVATIEREQAMIGRLNQRLAARPPPTLWDRAEMPYRRELLITFHNISTWIASYGSITPTYDFSHLGFKDERTLARSLRRFVADGYLVQEVKSPSRYAFVPGG